MRLDEVMTDLMAREPIFHRPAFARSIDDFAAMMAENYWEIGASGARYDRAFILEHLAHNPPVDADAEGWTCEDFELRELGCETFLLTYTLNQSGRHTRRSTLWRLEESGWKILYHQGTVLAAGAKT